MNREKSERTRHKQTFKLVYVFILCIYIIASGGVDLSSEDSQPSGVVEPSLADVVVEFLLDTPTRKGCENYEEAVDGVGVVVGGDDCDDNRVLDEPVPEPEVGQDLVTALVPADEAASEVVSVSVVPTLSLTELSLVVPS